MRVTGRQTDNVDAGPFEMKFLETYYNATWSRIGSGWPSCAANQCAQSDTGPAKCNGGPGSVDIFLSASLGL